jgi:hypothetical protein
MWTGAGRMDHLFSRYKTNNFIIRITYIHLSQASLRILAQYSKIIANILSQDYESLENSRQNEEPKERSSTSQISMTCPNGLAKGHHQDHTYPLLLNFVEDTG